MKLVTYEAIFDEDLKGVFGISLVESPATKETFIQLSEDEKEALKKAEIKLATIDEEQRLLIGLVLEPDAPVYRNQGGEEFNIVFRENTITQLAHNFFISDNHKNSTIEHDTNQKVDGVTFVESWIVADPKKDKSNAFGLEYKKGAWLVGMKVDSDEVWNDYVKTGKVKGFSIDAIVKLKEVKNKTEVSMSTVIEKLAKAAEDLAVALKLKDASKKPEEKPEEKEVEVKMGEVIMEGGEIVFMYEGDMLEPGVNVFAVDKADEENRIPVPVGSYPLEDGSVMVVEQEGIVASITPAEQPEEQPEEVEPVAAEAQPEQSVVNDIKSILIKYQEENNARLDKIEEQLEGMKKEVVEMSEQPREKPKTTRANIELNSRGRILEELRKHKN